MTAAIVGVVCFLAGALCYRLFAKRIAAKAAADFVNLSKKV